MNDIKIKGPTNDTDRLGRGRREGGQISLRYVRELRHSPEKVWAALTESEQLRAWMPIDLGRR